MSNTHTKFLFLFFFVWNAFRVTQAETFVVGDRAGWTVGGNVSYRSWAASKTFQVGDILLFQYKKQFHNVLEVSRADYRSCNAASPISTHNSGNDSIPIRRKGHHLFICGVPGHCQGGQRIDIRVVDETQAPSPAQGSTPPRLAPSSGLVQSPTPPSPIGFNQAPPVSKSYLSYFLLALFYGAIVLGEH